MLCSRGCAFGKNVLDATVGAAATLQFSLCTNAHWYENFNDKDTDGVCCVPAVYLGRLPVISLSRARLFALSVGASTLLIGYLDILHGQTQWQLCPCRLEFQHLVVPPFVSPPVPYNLVTGTTARRCYTHTHVRELCEDAETTMSIYLLRVIRRYSRVPHGNNDKPLHYEESFYT